ncbi:MAG: bifunctional riboflavin kinase/FAD synthetase [Chitinophagaceae bacterium]|nr:bifunctional riboflavin kinase/FAD synthetase [Chitinophagaceae bacterium]
MMKVYNDINQLPNFRNAVITIGSFDGFHTGHQQIIAQLINEAQFINGETVIITFHPHPRNIVNKSDESLKLLNTISEKIHHLSKAGIDHLVIIPFTDAFSKMHAKEYISNFLVKFFNPALIIIGYNHHFGLNREGNYLLLENMAFDYHYKVKEISEYLVNQATVSSSKVRKFLLEGNLKEANFYLGYNYTLSGTVVQGDQRGRTIGFPTANIQIDEPDKLIPANGVYAVLVKLKDEIEIIKGMMNIGIRPTIGDLKKTIEINLFDFDQTIYGESIDVTLVAYTRGEIKFGSLDELKAQLAADKIQIKEILSANPL